MQCEIDIGGDGEEFDDEVVLSISTDAATCCECNRSIAAGVGHEVCKASLHGDEVEYRTCPDCQAIAKALQKNNGRTYGDLWEALEDHGGEDGDGAFENFTSACLEDIKTASAKAYLVERWKKWKGLER